MSEYGDIARLTDRPARTCRTWGAVIEGVGLTQGDRRIPLDTLRSAIADALWAAVSAADLPAACVRKGLYSRLADLVLAARSPGEFALFDTYYRKFSSVLGEQLPALVPQVHVYYDPRTVAERGPNRVLARQRMDFLLLLDRGTRIVVEIDGRQHNADGEMASARQYAEMAAEDRRLRLAGHEIYRFGGAEFGDTPLEGSQWTVGPSSRALAAEFFTNRFLRHNVVRSNSPTGS